MKREYQSHNAAKVPEVFAGMLAVTAHFLQDIGVGNAENAALDLVFLITDQFNGELIYLPKAVNLKAERRNRELFKDHRQGAGYAALAKKYGISVAHTYDVVAKMRRLYLNDIQTSNEDSNILMRNEKGK
ncbi:MAG: hypothetical protein EPN21_00490 [Methylococcaceae bacterium]|nr:MAG: hypothetical protein EPN21_00490 [Methylococcaceae bacterium]